MAVVVERRSKRYKEAATKKVSAPVSVDQAVEVLKSFKPTKFDQSVELIFNLGIDPKHADQMVRGTVVLPHGLGKTKNVLVIAGPEKQKEATEAGADIVGAEDLFEKVNGGFMDFDRVIATPDMMGLVGRLGKVLGPRGLMPNPKVGTVTPNIAQAVKDAKGGSVEFRAEKTGIIHAGVGKASFTEADLEKNVRAFVGALVKARPSGAKGTYVKKIAISSTMGPGVSVDVTDISQVAPQ